MESLSKLKISMLNKHLKDIFSNGAYLELGSIDYNAINSLLKYQLVKLEDIAHFSIQNSGIGKSALADSSLKNILPYLYFENINHKNASWKLFLTYGLLSFRDLQNKECFAPLVLLPVRIVHYSKQMYFQLTNKPFENYIILNSLEKDKNINVQYNVRFDSVKAIDKYILSFEQIDGLNVSLENYLTYAYLQAGEIIIPHDKYTAPRLTSFRVNNRIFSNDLDEYYNITRLNQRQRHTLFNANCGNSFVIAGRQGTGKTTLLKNIVANSIIRDKVVFYVSNSKETLTDVYNFFKEIGLQNYVADLTDPFPKEKSDRILEELDGTVISSDLDKDYEIVEGYEALMAKRIANFRYIEVLEELSLLYFEKKELLEIDDLSSVFKSEYENIILALKKIQEKIGYFKERGYQKFKESIWREIPTLNNIKFPNQITSIIFQFEKCFRELEEERQQLENNFGFVNIQNYIFLRNMIVDISIINVSDIPKSWLIDGGINFQRASDEYKNLKKDIYSLQETEYFLNFNYDNLEMIDIDQEIKICLANYFTDDDGSKIDNINANRFRLEKTLNKIKIEHKLYFQRLHRAREKLKHSFPNNNASINEIIKMVKFLNKNNYYSKWFEYTSVDKFSQVKSKIKTLEAFFERNMYLENMYKQYFARFAIDDLNEMISILQEYESNGVKAKKYSPLIQALKKKYMIKSLTSIIQELEELRISRHILDRKMLAYAQITGGKYQKEYNFIQELEGFYDYINSIDNSDLGVSIIQFLKNVQDHSSNINKDAVKLLNLFVGSYHSIIELYDSLVRFQINEKKVELEDIIEESMKLHNYINDVFKSNDRMIRIVRRIDTNIFISFASYLELKNRLTSLASIKETLNNNKNYEYLYDSLYNKTETNINAISKMLMHYEAYAKYFSKFEHLRKSVEKETHELIKQHINNCEAISNSTNKTFTLYSRIFKDGASKYYYMVFTEVIEYLETLLNAKEELVDYLNITNGLKILDEYGLVGIINYIKETSDATNLVNDFKYTYFNQLKNRIESESKNFINSSMVEDSLIKIAINEQKYIKYNQKKIADIMRKLTVNKSNYSFVKKNNYREYINKNINMKRLFLVDTDILNNYLRINNIDMIVIDDAHLLNANEYHMAVDGKQVIIAGELQLHSTISSNLMSRLGHNNIFQLNHRYLPMPKGLTMSMNGLYSVLNDSIINNSGIVIIENGYIELVAKLIMENQSRVFNVFLSNRLEQKYFYDRLSKRLLNYQMDFEDIIILFKNNINISSLYDAYLYNADYNIVKLSDYHNITLEHISANLVDKMLLCKKKLIIFDDKGYLKSEEDLMFINDVKKVISNHENIFKNIRQGMLLEEIKNYLINFGFDVYSSHGDIDIIVSNKGKIYGLKLLYDSRNINLETINFYRDYYLSYKENQIDIINIWLSDLANDFEIVMNKVKDKISIK